MPKVELRLWGAPARPGPSACRRSCGQHGLAVPTACGLSPESMATLPGVAQVPWRKVREGRHSPAREEAGGKNSRNCHPPCETQLPRRHPAPPCSHPSLGQASSSVQVRTAATGSLRSPHHPTCLVCQRDPLMAGLSWDPPHCPRVPCKGLCLHSECIPGGGSPLGPHRTLLSPQVSQTLCSHAVPGFRGLPSALRSPTQSFSTQAWPRPA